MKIIKAIVASLALVGSGASVSGCSHLPFMGGVKAETYRQRLVQAEIAFSAVVSRSIAYKEAGKIPVDKIPELDGILESASAMLNAANDAERLGLANDFEAKILLFNALIQQAVLVLDDNAGLVGIQ